jgi:hypothetical protein
MVRQGVLSRSFARVQTGIWFSEPKTAEKEGRGQACSAIEVMVQRACPPYRADQRCLLPTHRNRDAFEELRRLRDDLPPSFRY